MEKTENIHQELTILLENTWKTHHFLFEEIEFESVLRHWKSPQAKRGGQQDGNLIDHTQKEVSYKDFVDKAWDPT